MRLLILASSLCITACSSEQSRSITSPTTAATPAVAAPAIAASTTASSAAVRDAPYLVIENVRFGAIGGGTGCEVILADVTNRGDAAQPFGWSWTVVIPKLHVRSTFVGQQPLAPGETRVLIHNPGPIEPGTYRVKVTADSAEGRTKGDGAILRTPCS